MTDTVRKAFEPADRRIAYKPFVPDASLPLHQHAFTGNVDALEKELKAHSKKDGGTLLLAHDRNGWTPLMCAALGCQLNALKWLVKQSGVDLSAANNDGYTAAHYMAAWPSAACCGANNDAKSATAATYEKVLRALLGACKKLPFNTAPDTLLHVAVDACNELAARLILQTRNEQAFVDARNGSLGWTALHFAAKHASVPLIRLLLVHGANPFVRTPLIGTAREVAQVSAQSDAELLLADTESEALRTLGAATALDIKTFQKALRATPMHAAVADSDGLTILHHLCAQAAITAVQWLLDERRCRAVMDLNQPDVKTLSLIVVSYCDLILIVILIFICSIEHGLRYIMQLPVVIHRWFYYYWVPVQMQQAEQTGFYFSN